MKSVQQLFTNTTNRLYLQLCNFESFDTYTCPSKILIYPNQYILKIVPNISPKQQYALLDDKKQKLECEINQAKQQMNMMMEMLSQICKIENGEAKQNKKWLRRSANDILDKYQCQYGHCKKTYSAKTSLQRHIQMKHVCIIPEPPQPYKDLHPEVNLIPFEHSTSQEQGESTIGKLSESQNKCEDQSNNRVSI